MASADKSIGWLPSQQQLHFAEFQMVLHTMCSCKSAETPVVLPQRLTGHCVWSDSFAVVMARSISVSNRTTVAFQCHPSTHSILVHIVPVWQVL